MTDTGKSIAYVGLAGLGAFAVYKLLAKPDPVEPGLVQKMSVRYRGPDGAITWDNKIVAEISWKNTGNTDIAPGFKLSMNPLFFLSTPIGDEVKRPWTISPKAKPGQIVNLKADSPIIPSDWHNSLFMPPFRIEMRLLLNDGGSGFLWDKQEITIVDREEKFSVSNFEVSYTLV